MLLCCKVAENTFPWITSWLAHPLDPTRSWWIGIWGIQVSWETSPNVPHTFLTHEDIVNWDLKYTSEPNNLQPTNPQHLQPATFLSHPFLAHLDVVNWDLKHTSEPNNLQGWLTYPTATTLPHSLLTHLDVMNGRVAAHLKEIWVILLILKVVPHLKKNHRCPAHFENE